MNTNLLIILIGAGLLLGIGLLWTWRHVTHLRKRLSLKERDLLEKMEHRRDTLPYLIESYRTVMEHDAERLQPLIEKRAEFRALRKFSEIWDKEQELEALVQGLLNETRSNQTLQKDIGWLEARTDLQKDWTEIEEQEVHYQNMKSKLDETVGRFPFVLFR